MGRKSLSEEKKIEIATLLKVCPNRADVARRANVSFHCVTNIADKINNGEALSNRIGQGRRRSTTNTDDRRLKTMVKKDRGASSKVLANEWGQAIGKTISAPTVRRRLVKMGLKSYVQKRKPFRNRGQIKRRRDWCNRMQMWSRIVWSDESHIELVNRKNRAYVRRYPYEKDKPFNFQRRLQGGGGSVSVWGCFTAAGPGPILFYDGRLNAARYTTILDAVLPQFAGDQFGDQAADWYFQQDNAPCHRARLTAKWFEDNDITVIPWPPTSPDLNPIENVWSKIDQKLLHDKISSVNDLKESITKIKVIGQAYLIRCVIV